MSQRGLFYGWVVVFAAATVVALGQGSLFSLGVFLKPLEDSMHWSRSAVSLTALVNWMAMGVGPFFWGAISDRLGSRFVTIAGGLLLGLSLVLSSQATALWHLHVTFGFGVGFAAGAFLTPFGWRRAQGGSVFHLVAHAIDQGVAAMVAATVLGVSGLASIGGRIACGMIADRFGVKPTLLVGLALQAVTVFSYLFTRDTL